MRLVGAAIAILAFVALLLLWRADYTQKHDEAAMRHYGTNGGVLP